MCASALKSGTPLPQVTPGPLVERLVSLITLRVQVIDGSNGDPITVLARLRVGGRLWPMG
jgi:hypothetical protein